MGQRLECFQWFLLAMIQTCIVSTLGIVLQMFWSHKHLPPAPQLKWWKKSRTYDKLSLQSLPFCFSQVRLLVEARKKDIQIVMFGSLLPPLWGDLCCKPRCGIWYLCQDIQIRSSTLCVKVLAKRTVPTLTHRSWATNLKHWFHHIFIHNWVKVSP